MDIVNWGIIGLGNINISHSILMEKKLSWNAFIRNIAKHENFRRMAE